jgi:S-adenosylmethionine:tRNA ribosyltransferase-isomerase
VSAAIAADVPARLEAHEPPEARGLARDEVRMLVARRSDGMLAHAGFRDLPSFLDPGDLLVVNTSATLPAALTATREEGTEFVLHLSTRLPGGGDDRWVVEVRRDASPFLSVREGDELSLPACGRATLLAPYLGGARLWIARLDVRGSVPDYLRRHGRPIRYRYVPEEWPLSAYQTVFAMEPGSAEMPSAARPFTTELVTELVARGIAVAPIVLHTGVSSLEVDERPYAEWFRVTEATARLVRSTRESGGRVVAVGTTVVRALESAVRPDGSVEAAEGWTQLVVDPEHAPRAVDAILTGWHEPEASHLLMLRAIGGRELIDRSYRAAVRHGYLWHEFGDVHLILP